MAIEFIVFTAKLKLVMSLFCAERGVYSQESKGRLILICEYSPVSDIFFSNHPQKAIIGYLRDTI